ncbi:pRL2-11 [Streptomyces sp. NPDC087272]|uniref:pRL2-11 n=1 Tax=Streptomyces sp. NPDC087272 TaxID=3365775 RepID=UPI0037FE9E8F
MSGDTLDGLPRTDRTWTHHGTPLTTKRADGRAPHRWDYLSRLEMAGLRAFGSVLALGTGYAAVVEPSETLQALQVSGLAGACSAASWAGFRGMDGLMTWKHRKDWVWPLHVVLREMLDLPEGTAPGSYLSVPQGYQDMDGDVIRIELPGNWSSPDLARQIAQLVITKLGLQDVKPSVRLSGTKRHIVFVQSPRAPRAVMFADDAIQARVAKASSSAPFLGLSHRDVAVSIDLDDESPHLLFSAAPGAGKSVLARALASQVLHHGGIVIIVDFKKTSHTWAFGLPNVLYVRSVQDAHEVLVGLAEEGNRRMEISEENVYRQMRDEEPIPMGPRILLIVEEANTMRKRLSKWWAKNKPEDDKSKESPAVEGLGEVLFMGRSQRMHAFMIGQSLTAQTVGGPEMREAFTARILARYTQNAWRMLVPEVSPIPKASRHSGRVQVVLAGQAHETQVLFMSDAEARDWATSGIVTKAPAPYELGRGDTLISRHTTPSHVEERVVSDSDGTRHLRAVESPAPDEAPATIGLAEAAKSVCAGISGPPNPGITTSQEKRDLMALRNARGRDPQFPDHVEIKGREKFYNPLDLEIWARNRISAMDEEEAGTGTE